MVMTVPCVECIRTGYGVRCTQQHHQYHRHMKDSPIAEGRGPFVKRQKEEQAQTGCIPFVGMVVLVDVVAVVVVVVGVVVDAVAVVVGLEMGL